MSVNLADHNLQHYVELTLTLDTRVKALERQLQDEAMLGGYIHGQEADELRGAIAALRSEVATMKEERKPVIVVDVPPVTIHAAYLIALTLSPWLGALVMGWGR